ncbi:hypothetical protein IWX76_001313 [Pedobacter sp. CAN_A7]|uniref:DUF5623 domain-containing protein n=1 Tax=Pedobacter sp. CAN_A7 TaxID=2787722 RepID=UPI0018CBB9AC
MKIKTPGPSAAFLKRKAKFLKKTLGITHVTSLDLVSKQYGFKSWNDYYEHSIIIPVVKKVFSRPQAPHPLVLDYHNIWTGAVIGQHPNVKMSKRGHKQVGYLLQDLQGAVEYHKVAKRVIREIIYILDTWLGCEYTEAEMQNEEFNSMYYNKEKEYLEVRPTQRQQQRYKRWLRKAKELINENYHDCKPLQKLHERFEMAAKALDKWPKKLPVPTSLRRRRKLSPGTFVRLIGKNQIGVVFKHPYGDDSVVGYADGGSFHVGRNEVRVLRKQLLLNDFRPMRLTLPYGKWTGDGGLEVLFNRDYTPIWTRKTNESAESINPATRVTHTETVFYYDDATAPYYGNAKTHEACLSVLEHWGVSKQMPKVMELLPFALTSGDAKLLSPKGIS